MKKGFTLIELLVVVSIIGVLATIIITSLGDTRARARDAQRDQDMRSIQNALELYYADNGRYPIHNWKYSTDADWDTFTGINLPEDPVNESGNATSGGTLNYTYTSRNSAQYCYGQVYLLVSNRETKTEDFDNRVTYCTGASQGYGSAFVVGASPRD